MPGTNVVLYREEDGSCPFLEWIEQLPAKVQAKCLLRVERLRELGHELRCPEADLLRDGIYELLASRQGHSLQDSVFLSRSCCGGCSSGDREGGCHSTKEIDRAIERKKRSEANPARHSHEEKQNSDNNRCS
jgi:hypothetical protein